MSIKNIVFGIVIAILTMFVSSLGMDLAYPNPEYGDFCDRSLRETMDEEEEDIYYDTCSGNYSNARELHSRNSFIMSIPLGIFIIIVGAFLFNLEAVGGGLMSGGAGTLVIGVMKYWSYSGNLLKFSISLIGLVLVMFITYWFNNKFSKKKFFGLKKSLKRK